MTEIVADPALWATTIPRSPPDTPYPVVVTDATLASELVHVEQHEVHAFPVGSLKSAENVDCWPTFMSTLAEGSTVTSRVGHTANLGADRLVLAGTHCVDWIRRIRGVFAELSHAASAAAAPQRIART